MKHEVVLEIHGLAKQYGGLRPLRIERLDLHAGESLALLGFDRVSAEVLVDLITGATLPDSGEVHVFGRSTRAIQDGDDWLTSLDRIGILSERAVLLDQMTVEQNLAIPFSLDLDPIPVTVHARVQALAREVGIQDVELPHLVADLSDMARLRLRLARAIALKPYLLLSEHPNAVASAAESLEFAKDLARVQSERRFASLTLVADTRFAKAVADRVLTHDPVTGKFKGRWFL